MSSLPYLAGYPPQLIQQIKELIKTNRLDQYIKQRYKTNHEVKSDRQLRDYVLAIKQEYLRKSAPITKIQYDSKLHVLHNALGTHTYVSRVQGSKLKSKNELRVSTLFKSAPEPFLNMIVAHELAHLKEMEHNKAFYKLCCHMLPDYHQLEFDTRVYLTLLDL